MRLGILESLPHRARPRPDLEDLGFQFGKQEPCERSEHALDPRKLLMELIDAGLGSLAQTVANPLGIDHAVGRWMTMLGRAAHQAEKAAWGYLVEGVAQVGNRPVVCLALLVAVGSVRHELPSQGRHETTLSGYFGRERPFTPKDLLARGAAMPLFNEHSPKGFPRAAKGKPREQQSVEVGPVPSQSNRTGAWLRQLHEPQPFVVELVGAARRALA